MSPVPPLAYEAPAPPTVCVLACVCCAVLEGTARCERMMHLIRREEREEGANSGEFGVVAGSGGGGGVGGGGSFHWERGRGRRPRLPSLQLSTRIKCKVSFEHIDSQDTFFNDI